MTPAGPSRDQRLFRALLRLLPQEFRSDFGDAMAADFDETRNSIKSRRVVWRRELPALVAAAVREHLSVLRRDVAYALRMMGRTPGFSTLAVVMLALGTGTNVAMFTVIDAVLLRSPFPNPEQLAIVQILQDDGRPNSRVPIDRFEALAASPRTLAAVARMAVVRTS